MKQATRYDDHARKMLGLPHLATEEDKEKSLETHGVPTDEYKVLASKLFNVDYCFVTPDQRRVAKNAMYFSHFQYR